MDLIAYSLESSSPTPLREGIKKLVRLDNDASELDILGHFRTFWDNSDDLLTSLEHLDCFLVIFDHFLPCPGD